MPAGDDVDDDDDDDETLWAMVSPLFCVMIWDCITNIYKKNHRIIMIEMILA